MQSGGGTPSTNDAKVQQIQKEAVPNGSITTGDAETNGPAVSPIEYVPLVRVCARTCVRLCVCVSASYLICPHPLLNLS